jgi:ATP/maltotriose-dependent transcriptional regulator MalT/DNA-binding SARP family transcriptional activator
VSDRHSSATDEPVAMGPREPDAPTREVGGAADGSTRPSPSRGTDVFPIQATKVQRPPLRAETLRRDRLLEWLSVKIHHRIVFVTADAGYGKTTLLADFARRSRLPMLWYRLDEDDRNWVSFVNYLVAAGRQIDPAFAAATWGLLREMGTGGPSRVTIVETLIRDFQQLAPGAVLILDDYHLVDDVPDVRGVIRDLIARAPERLTFVFVTRRPPTIPVARLRAQGEVAELTTDDLRFDAEETERLFRESYGRALEADVLADLSHRTEGWAASLQLVQSALRDRSASEVRSFIRTLNGARGDLRDYLAEEVVGELDEPTRVFLMRTSILQTVDPALAALATLGSSDDAARHLDDCEKLGLISRRGDSEQVHYRYHPLVGEFLRDRLAKEIGRDAVAALHRAIAEFAGEADWRLAAYHYAQAGDSRAVADVLLNSVQTIMASGQFGIAETYLEPRQSTPNPAFDILLSRVDLNRDRFASALERARRAHASFPSDDYSGTSNLALANLMTVEFNLGNLDRSIRCAQLLSDRRPDEHLATIAVATEMAIRSSVDEDLEACYETFAEMAAKQRAKGHKHYEGITRLNMSGVCRATGAAARGLGQAREAAHLLAATSAGFEVTAARALEAWALAHLGNWGSANELMNEILTSEHSLSRAETLIEAADLQNWYGDSRVALVNLEEARGFLERYPGLVTQWRLTWAQTMIREGQFDDAQTALDLIEPGQWTTEIGYKSRLDAVRAAGAVHTPGAPATVLLAQAAQQANKQRARVWLLYARLLGAISRPAAEMNAIVAAVGREDAAVLSIGAEEIVERLGDLDRETLDLVSSEVSIRPLRWRVPLRRVVKDSQPTNQLAAGRLLDQVGTNEDVGLLRALARRLRGAASDQSLGKRLARTLAPRAVVHDLGRVSVDIEGRFILGADIRRKVLALLCFLLTRLGMSATRDEVLEALWPELEPAVAVNSLNQTVYFLRRLFEPGHKDDLSAGYVHHSSDVLWLDPDLIQSRSSESASLIRRLRQEARPEDVEELSKLYEGRFALDFAYEEWAAPYRDSLHASYLEVVERAVADDTHSGHFDRAIAAARRAVEVDPGADGMEVSLLRLYRLSGAHAAAAEQYGHYAMVLRDELGVEPPPLDTL